MSDPVRTWASCGGQRKEHWFRKSNSTTHSKDYGILMRLALRSPWRNPPAGTAENEAVRKRFYRFRETLAELIPIPGDAFTPDGDEWKPKFTVRLHKDLAGVRKTIATTKEQVFEDWHPMAQGSEID